MSTIFIPIPLYPFSPPTPASSPWTPVQFMSELNMSLAYAIPGIQSSALGEKKLIDSVYLYYLMPIWCHNTFTYREYLCYRLPTSLHLASASYTLILHLLARKTQKTPSGPQLTYTFFLCCFATIAEPTALHMLVKHSLNKIDLYPSSVLFFGQSEQVY